MRVILKVHKKGIIVLPKKLREALKVDAGDEVIAELIGDKLVIKALKPRVVDVDPDVVEELLGEEFSLEKNRYMRMIAGGETSS